MKKLNYILISTLILILYSCFVNDDALYENNIELDNQVWKVNDTIHFDFDIQDTTSNYDFYLNIRNTANYGWANLYTFYELEFPNGQFHRDTAEFLLADPLGKWYGTSASGGIIDNSALFIRKPLPQIGKYKMSIVHGMREQDLKEITHVGLKLKKTKK